jgi:hypothetical protein
MNGDFLFREAFQGILLRVSYNFPESIILFLKKSNLFESQKIPRSPRGRRGIIVPDSQLPSLLGEGLGMRYERE